jgi:hypothetical protein
VSSSITEEPELVARKDFSWIFYIVCAIIMATGLYIRCSTLSVPLIWHDECTSLAHAAGSSSGETVDFITDHETTFGTLKQKFL